MGAFTRGIAVTLLGGGLALTGCAASETVEEVTETETVVAEPERTAAECEATDDPLQAFTAQAGEPSIEVPLPAGWTPTDKANSSTIRGAIQNESLAKDGDLPNVTVAITDHSGDSLNAQQIIDLQLQALETAGTVVESADSGTVCGLPSMRIGYTEAGHAINSVIVGAVDDTSAFAVVVAARTNDPGNAAYVEDMDAILDGVRVQFAAP